MIFDDNDEDDWLNKKTKPKLKEPMKKKAKIEKTESGNQNQNNNETTETTEPPKKKWHFGQKTGGPIAPGSKDIPIGKPMCLDKLTIVLTGSGEAFSREDLTDILKKYGAKVTSAVSGKTNYLVAGPDAGDSKLSKAKSLGTNIVNESEILQLIVDKSKGYDPSTTSTTSSSSSSDTNTDDKKKGLVSKQNNSKIKPHSQSLASTKTTETMPISCSKNAKISNTTSTFMSTSNSSSKALNEKTTSDILESGLQSYNSLSDMLWVDLYRPMKLDQLIGNKGLVDQIGKWLRDWESNRKNPKLAKIPKALLIHGPPGIGKTTVATLIAKSQGFRVVEFNASDIRNKAIVEEIVGDVSRNRALAEFLPMKKIKMQDSVISSTTQHTIIPAGTTKKSVIIMDEVDGMSGNADKGGMQALIAIIKQTNVPVICIANDASTPKMKTLKNYTECITWKRVPAAHIAPRLLEICKKEGLTIDRPSLEKIAESTKGDIRQMLICLQMWSKGIDKFSFDQVKDKLKSGSKDFDLGPFDVIPNLFRKFPIYNAPTSTSTTTTTSTTSTAETSILKSRISTPVVQTPDWIGQQQDYYYFDSNIIPLFVAENYLNATPANIYEESKKSCNKKLMAKCKNGDNDQMAYDVLALEALSEAADSISMGDIINRKMYTEQDYSLMPSHGFLSSVYPGCLMGGGLNSRIQFPSVLGKMSTQNKNARLVQELKCLLGSSIFSKSSEMAMYTLPIIRLEFMTLLKKLSKSEKKNDNNNIDHKINHENSDDDDDESDFLSNTVNDIIDLLEKLHLDKDAFDIIVEWGESFDKIGSITYQSSVGSSTKAKITRAWNQSHGGPTKSRSKKEVIRYENDIYANKETFDGDTVDGDDDDDGIVNGDNENDNSTDDEEGDDRQLTMIPPRKTPAITTKTKTIASKKTSSTIKQTLSKKRKSLIEDDWM